MAERPSSSDRASADAPGIGGAPQPGETAPAPAPSASPTEDATTDTFASYTPASGMKLRAQTTSINVPTDWSGEPTSGGLGINLSGLPDPRWNVGLYERDVVSPSTLKEQVQSTRQFDTFFGDDLERFDDVVIQGIPAYHVGGKVDTFINYIDEFGFETGGRSIIARVSSLRRLTPAEREEFVGSIMASLRVTG